MDLITLLFLAALGAALASFAALAAERVLRGDSVVSTPSRCQSCGARIAARDLIPLWSWLWLRGRCRACQAPIPPILWQAEGVGALAGIAAYLSAPDPGRAGLLLVWLISLLALTLADLRAFRLPNALVLACALAGAALVLAGDGTGWPDLPTRLRDAGIGALAGAGAFWLIRTGYSLLAGREGMGLGDVKLMGALGLVLGLQTLPIAVLMAAVAALCLALMRAARRGRTLNRLGRVPFGAALAVAAGVSYIAF